ncbi:hypothetical protein H6P81_008579 [Aristolochia fimbriata]|uniref:DNA-3-methyladenine glycosylase I n=1 Tax=Aristolochia fimbriata TaxID=158543 RepID=A0AAV7EJW3_ARIFI|nr:hypothetical protein H6P81_008579 [Aristolochia fimbriata]
MPTGHVRQPVLERNRSLREKEKAKRNPLSKHLVKVYPVAFHKTHSSLSLSSLTFSHNSSESSSSSSLGFSSWDRNKVPKRGVVPPDHPHRDIDDRRLILDLVTVDERKGNVINVAKADVLKIHPDSNDGDLKRCHWITKSTDQAYVSFHDERWGVPIYEDSLLFELLTLSGMLMDQNWTQILTKQDLYREVFAGFDANVVAKMEEKEMEEIASNKKLMLEESRVRCIVQNAKCILKTANEHGSFSNYIWGGFLNFRPIINRFKYPKNVPLRTPKSEAISKDLLRRGFRLVGPVITYSFMQAAGMTIDHLVHCFRFSECLSLVEIQWNITDHVIM